MSKKHTLQEVKDFAESVGYEVLDEEYIDAKTYISFKCKTCGAIEHKGFCTFKKYHICQNCLLIERYEEHSQKLLILCEKLNRIPTNEEIMQNKVIGDARYLNQFLIKQGYDGIEGYCRQHGFHNFYDIFVNNTYKKRSKLNLEDLKQIFIEFNKKYYKYPTHDDCNNKEYKELPTWDIVDKILLENNISLYDFYILIGCNRKEKVSIQLYGEYVQKFISISNELGRALKYNELLHNKWGLPTSKWFVKHCPNKKVTDYNSFIEYIGFKPRYHMSKEKAITMILEKQKQLDRPLVQSDFIYINEDTDIGISTINKIWGNMNNMKKELELKIVQEDMVSKHKTKDEMLKDMENFINKLGRLPRSREIDKNKDMLNCSSYDRYFGGINNIFVQLGYLPNKKSIALHLSDNELKEMYREFIEENGFVPSYDYCEKVYELPAPITLLRRFNCGWNEFITSLGYTPNEQTTLANICYAKDGTQCLSGSECLIHNYLLTLNLNSIEKEILYKDFIENPDLQKSCGFKRCDWIITYRDKEYIIEYFGLMQRESYRNNHDFKIQLITKDNKLNNFIAIYPKDLNRLDEIFSFIK